MEFLQIGFIELIDIALVAILIYQLYKIVKGTVAINIFIVVPFSALSAVVSSSL